jgi:hypothetical protein
MSLSPRDRPTSIELPGFDELRALHASTVSADDMLAPPSTAALITEQFVAEPAGAQGEPVTPVNDSVGEFFRWLNSPPGLAALDLLRFRRYYPVAPEPAQPYVAPPHPNPLLGSMVGYGTDVPSEPPPPSFLWARSIPRVPHDAAEARPLVDAAHPLTRAFDHYVASLPPPVPRPEAMLAPEPAAAQPAAQQPPPAPPETWSGPNAVAAIAAMARLAEQAPAEMPAPPRPRRKERFDIWSHYFSGYIAEPAPGIYHEPTSSMMRLLAGSGRDHKVQVLELQYGRLLAWSAGQYTFDQARKLLGLKPGEGEEHTFVPPEPWEDEKRGPLKFTIPLLNWSVFRHPPPGGPPSWTGSDVLPPDWTTPLEPGEQPPPDFSPQWPAPKPPKPPRRGPRKKPE